MLDKGKAPLGQAPDALHGPTGSSGVHPNTINPTPVASPLFVALAAMPASRPPSAPPSHGRGAKPPAQPPSCPTDAYPPLARPTKVSKAAQRRARADLRRPYQQSAINNTAFSNPAYSNSANANLGQHPSDTWRGPQMQFFQPMRTPQQFSRTDAGVSSQPTGGGHVSPPTCPPFWQYVSFPPTANYQVPGCLQVADPRASSIAIRSTNLQQMSSGHISAPTLFSFLLHGDSSHSPTMWQANQQTSEGQRSQHAHPTVRDHVSCTGNLNFEPSSLPKDSVKANGDRFDPHQSLNPSNPQYPKSTTGPPNSFANIVSGGTTSHRPSSTDLSPSSYPNLCYGQILGDVTHPGFVKSHVLAAGQFGLIPNLPIKPLKTIVDGEIAIEISDSDVEKVDEMFSTIVIIKFWKDRPPLDQIYKDIVERWGVVGRFAMRLRDNRTLLVRFENASDMVMALSCDNTFIREDSFKLYRWVHCVDGDVDAGITPVWIALPQLPDRCWFPNFFKEAGNSLGTFLRVDHPTAAMARPRVARMCVEVDLSKELPKKIRLKVKGVRIWQKVVYQNPPSYCVNCRMQGHSTVKCRRF